MTDKKTARFLRLKDEHPTMVKLNKLYDLAEELGLSLSFESFQTTVFDKDRDEKLPPVILEYTDTDSDDKAVGEWPPTFEFVARYENPKYLTEQEAEREVQYKAEQECQKQAAEKSAAAAAAAVVARRRRVEQQEREQLASLKAKCKE